MTMTTITTPVLSDNQRAAVAKVTREAELHDPAFSGATIAIVQDADAACCSVDGCDELAGARLLAEVNGALDAADDDDVGCECGLVMGEQCQWTGPASETVIVEWMPPQHRASHEAAGNAGSYPANGAVRIRCERSCAERIVADDDGWSRIVG